MTKFKTRKTLHLASKWNNNDKNESINRMSSFKKLHSVLRLRIDGRYWRHDIHIDEFNLMANLLVYLY